jgi:hypothetical protein
MPEIGNNPDMKNFILSFILFLLLATPALAANTAYSAVIEDLPLMPGMTEMTDTAIVFDKPGGRLVETSARTDKKAADVLQFYATALPALGWTASGNGVYTRDLETLTVSQEKNTVSFKIAPVENGAQE